LKTIARWISDDPFMLPMTASPLALLFSNIVSTVYEYLNLAFLLDANGVYFGAGELRARGCALLRLVAAIGEVDAAISVASVRAGRNDWTRPHFGVPGTPALLAGVRHPLVDDAVPNTIAIELGRGALITGSNMSGKSTFLRTIGVATVMAQTLNTCLASEYEAPVFRVRSCIGRTDDLLSGKSYYIAEVEALLELVEASAQSSSHLFLLDEVFRGTNAVERIAAGQAVLRELVVSANRARPHVVLAATHDNELVDLLSGLYTPWHFGDGVSADGLVFDHRLQPGRATTRNAIALLRLYGAPEALIKSALTCAAELDRQRGNTLAGR
jgi:DNA mismatch repair ATPase MutS